MEDITIATKPKKAAKTMEERKEAMTLRTLGKRANITLCVHGINKKYCDLCAKKSSGSKKAKETASAEKPAASAE